MALHADLMVNGRRIGWLYARRLSPSGTPTDDDMCRYEWRVSLNGQQASGAPLEHRYGDGAWTLVARIVEVAGAAD